VIRMLTLTGVLIAGITAFADPQDPAGEPKDPKKMPAVEPKKDGEIPAEEIDVAKTTERIVQDATQAGKRLSDKDPGDETQRLQRDVVKNIEALIRKLQEPPPMGGGGGGGSDSSKQPMNGGNTSKQPMGGMSKQSMMGGTDSNSTKSMSRKERRERNKAQANAKQGQQSTPQPLRQDQKLAAGNPKDGLNKIEPKSLPPRFPDVYKDVWGHLPEKMRQQMDLYFREQFMPRYSELLKQYYSSLAERGSKAANTP
jgi:hypothetical protein